MICPILSAGLLARNEHNFEITLNNNITKGASDTHNLIECKKEACALYNNTLKLCTRRNGF